MPCSPARSSVCTDRWELYGKGVKGKMKEKLEQIKAEAVARIQAADAPEKLNDVRVRYLG